MVSQGAPLELRIEKIADEIRFYFITTATDRQTLTSNLEQLEIALSAHLPDFKVERCAVRVPAGLNDGVVVLLTGEPLPFDDQRQSCDALTAATEALHTVSDGIIQVHAKPAGSARFSALLKEREVRKLTEKAQKTVAIGSSGLFSKDKQESVVQIDVSAGTKAHRASRELQRLRAEIACDVTVNVCCWAGGSREGEKRARYLMSSLLGALVPADVEADFKTTVRHDRQSFDRVVNGRPVGRGSRLLTTEAATYFVLPRCDAGIKISRREAFSTASESIPEKKSAVETVSTIEWNMRSIPAAILGTPLNRRGDPIGGKLVWIGRDDMDSHLAIYGLPRQGKTTSAFSIVAQLLRSGLVPLIIVPAKSFDWRKFKHLFPTTRIFTAGDSQTSPLRINIWRPPSGVPLAKWLHRLVDVFSAWLPNDDVISMHFDDVLHTMYRNCGWSIRDNIQGRPILLVDFYDAVVEVLNRLDYGPEIRQNFIGALQARLGAIFRNHALVDIFNTPSGITFEELLHRPTIIEMEKLYRDNKRLLAGVLTAGVCEYILANPRSSVDNLLVLEEAHTFLKNPSRPGRESPSSSEMAIESLVEMLRVVGGAGLGVVVIDQEPGELVREVVKLPGNTIIHRLTNKEERTLVGDQAGCDPSQIDHITILEKGEAIVTTVRDGTPKNVRVQTIDRFLEEGFPRWQWTDQRVREAMNSVFEEHSEFADVAPMPPLNEKAISAEQANNTPQTDAIDDLVGMPAFSQDFAQYVRQAESGDILPLLIWTKHLAKQFCPESGSQKTMAEDIYSRAREAFSIPRDDQLSSRIVKRMQQEMEA
jgi:hypothetical protein